MTMPSSQGHSSNVRSFDPHKVFNSKPIWAHATSSVNPSRFITTAGQVGADENNVVPSDIDEEIRLAFENLRRCLDVAGAGVTDILKLVYYIVNFDHQNRPHSRHLQNFLQGHRPATTLVPVQKLAHPDYHFEIEAYAAVEQRPTLQVDVVVVGAGLSGLRAALDIQKAGLSCVVVEARDRVGGKTWSVEPLEPGKVVDVGAAWINDTTQSEIYALTKELGLKTVVQNTVGNVIQEDIDGGLSTFPYGSNPRIPDVENMVELRELVEKLCQKLDIYNVTKSRLDELTLQDFALSHGAGNQALASVRVWTRAMLGLEPSELSALFFLNYCKSGGGLLKMRSDQKDGGQYLRLVKGTQSISKGLVELLNPGTVLLKSPVQTIEQDFDGVHVMTARGQVHCKRVIVSIPTPLYQTIQFHPSLPEEKQQLSQDNKLGYTNKVMVLYDSPWWRDNLCGLLQSFVGPITVTRDSSVDEIGQYSLTCFLVGQLGRDLSKVSQEARFKAVLAHIEKAFGPFAKVSKPIAITEHEWASDQWAQGCPCPAAPPEIMTKYERFLRSPYGKLHFVGTETAHEWKGYMEGAVRSGVRGAQEVITSLSRPKL